MTSHSFIYPFSAVLIAAVYLMIAWTAWQRRATPGAVGLTLMMIAAAAYAVPYILEISSPTLASALFWMRVALPGASLVTPAWLIFATHYRAQKQVLTRWQILLLSVIPIAVCLAAWVEPARPLYGSHFAFNAAAQWPTLTMQPGPLYWINFFYAYLCFGLGTLLLLRSAAQRMRIFTRQTFFLVMGALIPATIYLLFKAGITPMPDMDLTPFSFLITGILWSLALFRFRLLDLVPVAHGLVLETMPVGVMVFDRQGRVVEHNPAAARLLQLPPHDEPLPARLTDASFPLTKAQVTAGQALTQEVALGGRAMQLQLTPLGNARLGPRGALLLAQDITEHKQAEQAQIAQRQQAERLRAAVADLTTTLALPEMVERVLANLAEIVSFDAAQVSVWGSSGEEEGEMPPPVCRFITSRPIAAQVAGSGSSIPFYPPQALAAVEAGGRAVLRVEQPEQWGGCAGAPERDWVAASLVMVLHAQGEVAGLALIDRAAGAFEDAEVELLEMYAAQASIAIENARLMARLEIRAVRDDLTRLYNRRGLFEIAANELARAHRFKHPLGLILFDLDHYKEINDTYGHLAGDKVLHMAARVFQGAIREIDSIGRYGGDEFVIILPECDLSAAATVAERVRKALEKQPFDIGGLEISMTLSAGVAADEGGACTLDDLLRQADQALYRAKSAGRNCVR